MVKTAIVTVASREDVTVFDFTTQDNQKTDSSFDKDGNRVLSQDPPEGGWYTTYHNPGDNKVDYLVVIPQGQLVPPALKKTIEVVGICFSQKSAFDQEYVYRVMADCISKKPIPIVTNMQNIRKLKKLDAIVRTAITNTCVAQDVYTGRRRQSMFRAMTENMGIDRTDMSSAVCTGVAKIASAMRPLANISYEQAVQAIVSCVDRELLVINEYSAKTLLDIAFEMAEPGADLKFADTVGGNLVEWCMSEMDPVEENVAKAFIDGPLRKIVYFLQKKTVVIEGMTIPTDQWGVEDLEVTSRMAIRPATDASTRIIRGMVRDRPDRLIIVSENPAWAEKVFHDAFVIPCTDRNRAHIIATAGDQGARMLVSIRGRPTIAEVSASLETTIEIDTYDAIKKVIAYLTKPMTDVEVHCRKHKQTIMRFVKNHPGTSDGNNMCEYTSRLANGYWSDKIVKSLIDCLRKTHGLCVGNLEMVLSRSLHVGTVSLSDNVDPCGELIRAYPMFTAPYRGTDVQIIRPALNNAVFTTLLTLVTRQDEPSAKRRRK